MKNVTDVLKRYPNAVLVLRHGHYLIEPYISRLIKIQGVNEEEVVHRAHACILSLSDSDRNFSLSGEGIAQSIWQGRKLASANIPIFQVVGANTSRAAQTASFICEGYHDIARTWIPFGCDSCLNHPAYNYDRVLREKLQGNQSFVQNWLRKDQGFEDVVVPIRPDTLLSLTATVIEQLFDLGGIHVLVAHFEQVVIAHALFVDRVHDDLPMNSWPLQNLNLNWGPANNAGVIIWKDGSQFKARDFLPKLALI